MFKDDIHSPFMIILIQQVKELMWNTDSSVLVLWLENLDRKELEDYNEQHGKTQPCPIPDQVEEKTKG